MKMNWNQLLSKECFYPITADSAPTFQTDYNTIICSTLFRRLQDKAQVFPLDEDDYVRTRLTHSLEVSSIGKTLGEYTFRKLKNAEADPWFANHHEQDFSDILLCAGLIHDIGNPPFGHFGEFAIREWFQAHLHELTLNGQPVAKLLSDWQLQDLYTFEGNAQSIRLLSKTPYQGTMHGFNLSYAVLASIIKYPISSDRLANDNPFHYKKIGYNYSERELFKAIDQTTGMNGCRHPLSYLLEAADDIAYRTSDVEDSMVKKVLGITQIFDSLKQYHDTITDTSIKSRFAECAEKLKTLYRNEVAKKIKKPELSAVQQWNQYLQTCMIHDAGDSFLLHYEEIMNGTFHGDLFDDTCSGHVIQAISNLSEKWIYTSSIKTKTELYGRRVIDSLLTQFMPAAIKYNTDTPMTFIECRIIDTVSDFYKSMYHAEAERLTASATATPGGPATDTASDRLYLRILMITDYISGMTDNYAKRLYQELFA